MKRLIAVFCSILLLVSLALPISAKEELYEKYGYDEYFEYENEFIAHALKSTVVKIMLDYSVKLEYSPISFDVDFLEDLINYLYFEEDYPIEEISAFLEQDLKESTVDYLKFDTKRSVDVDGTYVGSGVVISEDGYIATNSHVITLGDSSKKELYLSDLYERVLNDLEDVVKYLEDEWYIEFTEEQLESLIETVLLAVADDASIHNENTSLTVCFPTARGNTDINDALTYPAEVIAEGTQDSIDSTTQDTAILKIDASNLVALRISNTYPLYNSKIVTAGYPVASDAIFQNYGSSDSVMSVTIGTGEVARIVPIEASNYSAIEINTNISGGNSGGPSVDNQLFIEGLNTYGLASDMRYAYMVPAEYLRVLTSGINTGHGTISKNFFTGLQMLQLGNGDAAEECFEYVADKQPDTPYIKTLISLANKATDKAPATDIEIAENSIEKLEKDISQLEKENSALKKKLENAVSESNNADEKFYQIINLLVLVLAIIFLFIIIIVIVVLICKAIRRRREKKKQLIEKYLAMKSEENAE
ncbi:MAG: trypsin-like peptidase domain-containing protein [Clostridia bacterium]|nr:trypsin-like peptidase domain-containing protein [Clostridia bacterium]